MMWCAATVAPCDGRARRSLSTHRGGNGEKTKQQQPAAHPRYQQGAPTRQGHSQSRIHRGRCAGERRGTAKGQAMTAPEKPKYRNRSGEVIAVGATLYPPNALIGSAEWPRARGLEPVNESARRVMRFFERRRHAPFFPQTAMARDGTIFLPAIMHPIDPFDITLPGLPPDFDVSPDAPAYKCNAALRVGHRDYAIGERAVYLGWPTPLLREPVNEAAAAVCAYFKTNAEHGALLSCPWNLYSDSVFLPALPDYERRDVPDLPPTAGVKFTMTRALSFGKPPERPRDW
jgi:hypothetical protein